MKYTDDVLIELGERFQKLGPEERAYVIISNYMKITESTPEMTEKFHKWLYNGRGLEAKMRAYMRVFDEVGQESFGLTDEDLKEGISCNAFFHNDCDGNVCSSERATETEILKIASCS